MDLVKIFLVVGVIVFLIVHLPSHVTAVPSKMNPQSDIFVNPNDKIDLKNKITPLENDLKKKRIDELCYNALKFSQERKFDKALEEYKKVLAIDPNMAMVHNDIAWAYIQRNETNDLELATLELKEAVRLDPDLILAHRNLWWVYRLEGKSDIALQQLEKIIQLEPEKAENYINLADSYLSDAKDFSRAVKTYRKAIEIRPENHIYIRLAKALEFQGKYEEAIKEFEKIIEKSPRDCYPYLFLAVAMGKSGKKKDISEKMKGALKIIQEQAFTAMQKEWQIKLLKFYAGELSEKDLLSEASLNPIAENQAFYYIGMKYLWESDKDKALTYLKKCIEKKVTRSAEFEYAKIELYLQEKK